MSTKLTASFLDAKTINCDLVKPPCISEWEVFQNTKASETKERIANANVVYTNKVRIEREDLATAKDIKLIVVAATGYDIIDLDTCRKMNIAVANSPGYSVSSVPEHTVALMFTVAKKITALHNEVMNTEWAKSDIFCMHNHLPIELAGKNLGIIGAGSLGQATGKLCEALGMNVSYLAKHDNSQDDLPRKDLATLLAESDVISLHCPLTENNFEMFNADTISQMKDGAILINTARGALVNYPAMIKALESGKLSGAGIDVLAKEPPTDGHVLLECKHPGLVVTPHVAWASLEAQTRLVNLLVTTTEAFFSNEAINIVS